MRNTTKTVQDFLNLIAPTRKALTAAAASVQTKMQAAIVAAQANPNDAVPTIQTAITSSLTGIQSLALTQALAVASKIAQPVCPAVGNAATKAPVDVPTQPDYSIFGPLAAPVKQIDNGVSDALYKYYVQAMATLLAPQTLPPGTEAIAPYVTLAQALLSLLKINWHTEVTSANGTTKVIRDTPGFLNLPMVIDSDRNAYVDVCANFGLDLTSGTVTQQIDRVPTADRKMRLDILGQFLGLVNVGYETAPSSSMPTMYQTTTTLTHNPVTSNVQQPGANFTQIVGYALKSNTFSPATCPTSNPNCTKTHTVLDVNIQLRLETVKSPTDYTYSSKSTTVPAVPPATTATTTSTVQKFTGSAVGTAWSYKTRTTGSLKVTLETPPSSVVTLIDSPLDTISGIGSAPLPRAVEYCTSTNRGLCSNAPASLANVQTSSMRIIAFSPVTFHTFAGAASAPPTVCPTTAETHLNVTKMWVGVAIPTSAQPNGHAWLDTDGLALSGCHAVGSSTSPQSSTYPSGFSAQDRLATWTGTASNTPAVSKSGAITCPTGTVIKSGSFVTGNYLCPAAPANTAVPTLTGDPFQESTLTLNKGTWNPLAPNLPTFTNSWLSCNASGASCTVIAGETASTYKVTAAQLGKTIRGRVTATNLDGSVSIDTAPTAAITLPPSPFNVTLPVITGVQGSGHTLSVSNGTWGNSPESFTYQWRRCDSLGNNCSNIGGATASTYNVSTSDEGLLVTAVVTATNIGGSNAATALGVNILNQPANTVLPIIKNGNSSAIGQSVLQGDHLSATTGTWNNALTYTYQWLRCDGAGDNCSDIGGATSATYIPGSDDIPNEDNSIVHTLKVVVTGHNNNVGPTGEASVTTLATGIVAKNSLLQKNIGVVPDGRVFAAAAASSGDSSYLGGSFDTVGANAGKAGSVGLGATASGVGLTTVAKAAKATGGDVKAILSDGAGGYFIGGSFTSVGGQSCPAFARILTDGAVDAAYCNLANITGEVRALTQLVVGGKLLALGGLFSAGGHNNVMFVDITTLASPIAVHGTDLDPNGAVNALGASGTTATIYMGGDFTAAGSEARGGLSSLTVTGTSPSFTIARSTWVAGVCNAAAVANVCGSPASVRTVYWSSLGLLVGGSFSNVYNATTNTARNNVTGLSTSSGAATGWYPNTNGPVNAITGSLNRGTTTTNGSGGPYTIYIGGDFTTVNGAAIPYLAEFGLTIAGGSAPSGLTNSSGPSTTFVPAPNGPVNTLVSPNPCPTGTACTLPAALIVGGNFTKIGGQARNRIARIEPRTWNEATNATISSTWTPNAGGEVLAVGLDSGTNTAAQVFVGGRFRVLGGAIRNNAAEITAAGALTNWDPNVAGTVKALLVKGAEVYIGGDITGVGGLPRTNLAAVSAASGMLGAFSPNVNGTVNALAPSATGVFAGGSFTNNLADIASDGTPNAGFTGDTDGPVYALVASGGDLYVGGQFSTASTANRANIARMAASDGTIDSTWKPGTNGKVLSMALSGEGLFIGGDFSQIGLTGRNNIGLISDDGSTNASFDPNANGAVRALKVFGSKLFAGGDFTNIGGADRSRAAQLNAGSGDTGDATGFLPEPNDTVYALTLSPGNVLGVFGQFISLAGGVDTIGLAFYG